MNSSPPACSSRSKPKHVRWPHASPRNCCRSSVKRRALQELERIGQDPRLGPCLDPRRSPLGADAAAALRARLDTCQRLNLATGGAIVTARRDNEQALRLLGHAPDIPAYGVRGQSPAGAPSRTLGRA